MSKSFVKRIGGGMRAFGRALPDLAIDAAGLGGVGAIAYGAWLIYAPAGFIVGGILILAGAVVLAASRRAGGGNG